MLYNDTLSPEVWRINAGSTLNVRLINRLHCHILEHEDKGMMAEIEVP